MLSRHFNYKVFLIFFICVFIGCNSQRVTKLPRTPAMNNNSPEEDYNQRKKDFVELFAAIIKTFGKDAKSRGYTLIFTDIGPESLEKSDPDLFNELITKASTKEVRVRGLRMVISDAESVYDEKTGEKGVCFMVEDMQEDGRGGYVVNAFWHDSESPFYDVKYHLIKKGKQWVTK